MTPSIFHDKMLIEKFASEDLSGFTSLKKPGFLGLDWDQTGNLDASSWECGGAGGGHGVGTEMLREWNLERHEWWWRLFMRHEGWGRTTLLRIQMSLLRVL